MKVKNYKDLIIWQTSFDVARQIIKTLTILPSTKEIQVISYQVIRSATSVGANIAEGFGRYGPREYFRYLQIALGSANETEHWLLLLQECSPKHIKLIEKILFRNQETIKMLAASLKTLSAKKTQKT